MDKTVTSTLEPSEYQEKLFTVFASESSISGLIKTFFKHIQNHFRVGDCFCFLAKDKGVKFSLASFLEEKSDLSNYFVIDKIKIEILKNLPIKLKADHIRCFPEKIVLLGKEYEWLFLGNKQTNLYVCVWLSSEITDKDNFSLMIRLLHHEVSWYSKLDRTQAQLYIDDLTGLFNYRYLDVALDSEIRRATRYQNNFSLLFIDLDDFKKVNDQHGHLVGSSILKQFAAVLKEELREVDTIIRYGGDEFIVLLIGTDTLVGISVAERIRSRVASTYFFSDIKKICLTCSIGVSCFPDHGKRKVELLKMADETMYDSKKYGKNQVRVVKTSLPVNISLES